MTPGQKLLRTLNNHSDPKSHRHVAILVSFLFILLWVSTILHAFSNHLHHRIDINNSRLISRMDFSRTRLEAQGFDQDTDRAFFCDRSHHRTDVCQMKGDVRVDGQSGRVLLYSPELRGTPQNEERVRPYTRKWETSLMETIGEVTLRRVGNSTEEKVPECDVQFAVPAIVFSTGGYTGNLYHEFNDGLIPLFISSQHLKGEVVFMILEYHNWWKTKYEEILRKLTNYDILEFSAEKRVHCFPEIMVGLRIHDELAIDPQRMKPAVSMRDFQRFLLRAYLPRLHGRARFHERARSGSAGAPRSSQVATAFPGGRPSIARPKLVIVSRESPRAVLNEVDVVNYAKAIGFEVEILAPKTTTELVDIYQMLNSCDVMVGVHGAALTHFLFLRPGSTFIQVIPLGVDWAAFTYYEEPAMKLGLDYVGYKIIPEESSLSKKYDINDPVLTDPNSVNSKGWWETKKIYLESQDVRLSLDRFGKILRSAYGRAVKRHIGASSTPWKHVESLSA